MQKLIAIALVFAVAFASSKNFQDTHTVLAEMETSQFG